MNGIRFEWDEAKNRANMAKHGISFRRATQVFDDPHYISVPERIEDGEQRWQAFGLVEGHLLLMAAHTIREQQDDGPLRLSGSSRHERRRSMRGGSMKKEIVSYTWETLPPLTKADRVMLKRLAEMPDSEIDLSDAPELTDEQWKNAERRRFYRPVKRQITARVDADVLAWLKGQGKGYQSRINAILRREMLEALKKEVA
jgi:uncharacterized protein (DUF4415 family)